MKFEELTPIVQEKLKKVAKYFDVSIDYVMKDFNRILSDPAIQKSPLKYQEDWAVKKTWMDFICIIDLAINEELV